MNTSPELLWTGLKMLAALAAVLVAILFFYNFTRRMAASPIVKSKEGPIRVVSNRHIGVKKSLLLVEVPGSLLVLGVTNDHIACLSKIEDDAVIEKFKREDLKTANPSFATHFQRISSKLGLDKKRCLVD